MSSSRVLKWLTGAFEIVLAIPFLGGALVIGSGYSALGLMFILHLITLILSSKNREPFYGSVVGILTSLIAWIPIVGWVMHLISGILLMVSAAQKPRNDHPTYPV
ncbi:hypothetical protein GCM10010912_08730 [Paenibacillus albidus]|uniref:Uncharacterized protein n=1 Tax=Paenibacillus albidus TaxID=2041023 RepID=A0A917C0J2_9BACL|nr:hypothetical protein [Paenibacillus albidus]MBT2289850.1 hypothetical protein [Paenibacillus albidus]GGF65934.1 hypothetical protein GCM10010912_08730 [Paenibacillus albidus]